MNHRIHRRTPKLKEITIRIFFGVLGGRWIMNLIGIAGGSGSGKTLVAQRLLEDIGSDKFAFIQEAQGYRAERGRTVESVIQPHR